MNIKRRLGQSEIMLSPLGVGTWQFSNKGGTWNTVTDKTVYEILKYSLTNGMNWIDTAEIYGNGISETLIGQALKQLEAEKALTDIPYIADKWFPLLRTADTITKTINQRLDCLQKPVIDLYQIHQPTSLSSLKEQIRHMAELADKGIIKNVGISNFTAKGMGKADKLLREHGLRLASNQVKYNLLHRKPEKNGVIETAKELGISIIAYSPLQQGMLTGRFHNDLSATDNISLLRRFHSGISRKNIERTRPLIDTLNKLEEKYQKTPAQISLNWLIYSQGELVFAIPGATKLEQAQSNIKAQSFRLSQEDIELLNKVSESI